MAQVSLRQAPARQHTMRHHNLALVLQHIAAEGPLSRARIASLTGLTRATVSSLVDDLRQAALVTELGPRTGGGIGRAGAGPAGHPGPSVGPGPGGKLGYA